MTAEQRNHENIMAQVLAHLEEEQDKHPEIFYELRPDDSGTVLRVDLSDMTGTGLPVPSPSDADMDELWQRAAWAADWLSGRLLSTIHVWQVRVYTTIMGKEKRREESYVVTSSGGSQYWDLGAGLVPGPLHQMGSGGFCWDCLKSDPDMDMPARGLVRHPVTPGEIGALSYRCHVCGVDVSQPGAVHEEVTHLVLFGKDSRCDSCGLGFRYATPEGTDYEPHRADCPAIS